MNARLCGVIILNVAFWQEAIIRGQPERKKEKWNVVNVMKRRVVLIYTSL